MSYIYIYILHIPYGYRDIVKIHNILILNLLIIHNHIYVSFVAQDLTLDETYVQD